MGVFYNTRLCAFGLIFMLFIPSCNIVDVNVPYTEQINKSSTGYGIQTKSAIDSYRITEDDAFVYFKAMYPKDTNVMITPYTYKGDTLLYAYNRREGWELIAADKRMPLPLARDSIGFFKIEAGSEYIWLENQYQLLQAIRNDPNNRLSEYTLFWEKLLRKKSIKRQNSTSETKSLNYYWVKTFDRMEKVASTITYNIPHLIATSWGQSYPWNTKCPYVYCNEDPNGKRGYTGCVAVSTAQVLYYLHYKIGKPNGLYHTVSSSGISNDDAEVYTVDISQADYHPNSTRWDQMPLDKYGNNTSFVADFMLSIGKKIDVHYGYNGSSAYTNIENFAKFDIESHVSPYSLSIVLQELENENPVVVRSTANYGNGSGHSWIIDGYAECREEWRDCFCWEYRTEYDPEEEEAIPASEMFDIDPFMYEGKVEYEYYTIDAMYLRMNFGWDGSYSSTLFTTYPSWSVGNSIYNTDTRIVYGFN